MWLTNESQGHYESQLQDVEAQYSVMKDEVPKKFAQALEGALPFENGDNIPNSCRWRIVPTIDVALEAIRFICDRSGNVSQFFPYGNNQCLSKQHSANYP